MNSNNPFAKSENLDIGSDAGWKIDKAAGLATKSSGDGKGFYYHLEFDNTQLKLTISSDEEGNVPKSFNQLEVTDLVIDGERAPLFTWCLNNQERHNRFLQQGLNVNKDICSISGNAGTFIMRLNRDTLVALNNGKNLEIMLKPFRTPLILNYELSDFNPMYIALNTKAEAVVVKPPVSTVKVLPVPVVKAIKPVPVLRKICNAYPPQSYTKIKSIEYDCDDAKARKEAESHVAKQVAIEKARKQELAAEKAKIDARAKERQLQLTKEKEQKELAAKLKQQELQKSEAAALAASQEKQSKLNDQITKKMLNMCMKYWSKGEHRCYCQKYIEHAPAAIQASASCD